MIFRPSVVAYVTNKRGTPTSRPLVAKLPNQNRWSFFLSRDCIKDWTQRKISHHLIYCPLVLVKKNVFDIKNSTFFQFFLLQMFAPGESVMNFRSFANLANFHGILLTKFNAKVCRAFMFLRVVNFFYEVFTLNAIRIVYSEHICHTHLYMTNNACVYLACYITTHTYTLNLERHFAWNSPHGHARIKILWKSVTKSVDC